MEPLIIKPTDDTPLINLDPDTGEMIFSGNSLPENASLFYEPVINWLDMYNHHPHMRTNFIFNVKVISSSSTKIFFDILNKIDALHESGKSAVNVLWYYSVYDDQIREIGLDYKDSMNANFELELCDK
ncbi:MAG TPA: DUF1987 domain-containing protein [Bacteroidales bacterium]|nr:DUF1987 domain-containing protein [Bacteroidales bacterium]